MYMYMYMYMKRAAASILGWVGRVKTCGRLDDHWDTRMQGFNYDFLSCFWREKTIFEAKILHTCVPVIV